MLIFVDLILGPLLVFIIYKKDKKYLTFDINVLLSIQLFAFFWGAYSLYLKHPAYVVFVGDRFTLTNVSHLYPQLPWFEQLKTNFFSSPKFVIAKAPGNTKERNALLFEVMLNGAPDIDERPEYYEPFKKHLDSVMNKSLNSEQLFSTSSNKNKLDEFIKQHGGIVDDYSFFPLIGNNKKEMIWVFDRATAKPVDIIDSDPWVLAKK